MESKRWAVLGGGVLGITLALELAKKGHKVSLIEGADTPGGMVTPWEMEDVVWDRFYHVIVSSDSRLLDTLERIGLAEQVAWGQTNTLFFGGKGLHPLNNVFDYLKLPELSLIDKFRLGLNIIYGSRIANGARLDNMLASEWLTKISGRKAYERLWRPLLRAKLGSNEPHASAMFIWSVMRRFYGAREGKSKVELFGYVEGGYRNVIEHFTKALEAQGVELVCNARVESVDATEDGSVLVSYAGQQRTFERATMTFAAPIASRVCPALSEAEHQGLNRILYQGVVCVSLLLKRGLGGAYLTYITDESLPFTTIIEMSSLVDREQLGGYHLVYLPKYVPSDDEFLCRDDDSIMQSFIDGVRKMYPDFTEADIVSAHVARTPFVAPVMTRHYADNIPQIHTSVPGVSMLSSAHLVHGSSSVEETMRLVDRCLPELMDGKP